MVGNIKNETKQPGSIDCITSDPEVELQSFTDFWEKMREFD